MPALAYSVSLKSIEAIFGGGFSPVDLFSSGEQGAWYDPSDFSTMFQDAAGTTPVTAVEQPVGLLLDKRGSSISYNPATMTISSYDGGGATTIVRAGANLTFTSAAISDGIRFNAITVADNYAVIEFIASGSGSLLVYAGAVPLTVTLTGTPTAYRAVTHPNGSPVTIFRSNSAGLSASITINAVYAIRGNHASQSTAASRPVLSARVNLLTYSEAIASSFLTGGSTTLTNNQAVTPSGAPATRLVPTTDTGSHYAYYAPTFGAGTFTFSLEVKAAGYPRIGLRVFDTVGYRIYATIDLTTGLPVGTPTGTVTTTNLGDGWWKISVQSEATTSNMGGTTGWVIESLPSGVTVQSAFTGDGTSGMFVSKVDIRVTNAGVNLPAYQRVGAAVTATTNPAVTGVPDYDTSGFPLYLKFDGVDDSLATGSINLTGTSKLTAWAGVRKLSDASLGAVFQFASSGLGSFGHYAPEFVVPRDGMTWEARGTGSNVVVDLAPYAAPVSYVLTGETDLAAPLSRARINGGSYASSTSALGGSFSTGTITLGERSASYRFKGNLYSLIVRGAASTDAQIASTETYVNSKTGAY